MAEATALDALLHDKGPLRAGSWRMAATLSAMMLSVLALTDEAAADKPGEDDDASDAADDDDAGRMLDMPIEDVVAIPVPDSSPVRRRARVRAQTEPTEPIPIARPTSVRPAAAEKTELPIRRGRYRPQF